MNKNVGIIRRVDELGRIVIPKGIRSLLDLQDNDEVEISLEENKIVITKREETCVFCGKKMNLIHCGNKALCTGCLATLKNL